MLSVILGVLLLFPQLIDSTKNLEAPVPSASEISNEKRGDIFAARKMYREAVESYREALKESPRNARLYNKIGISYHRQQMFGQAKEHYEQAAKLDARFAEAVNNLGTIYFAEHRYGKAQRTYEKALKLTPNSATFYSNLGTAFFARRKYEKATEAYMKALEIDPAVFEYGGHGGTTLQDRTVEERGKYYYYVAQAFVENGQFDRALLYLRRSMEEGFGRAKRAYEDSAFSPLHEMPEFLALFSAEETAANTTR